MGKVRGLEAGGRCGDPRVTSHTDFLKLRSWLALREAAGYIAEGLASELSGVTVLRLCLDGYLPLSLYLPVDTKATEYRAGGAGTEAPKGTRIEGLWDVFMDSIARKQLEHDYEWTANRNFIDIGEIGGATVQSGAYRFRLEPQQSRSGLSTRPRCAFPEGSVPAIRTAALETFIASRRKSAPEPPEPPFPDTTTLNNPVGERERTTLLTLIAALCQHAKIDVARPSAAGVTIAALTEALGARVSARTIENHLRKIPDALERRGKTSS